MIIAKQNETKEMFQKNLGLLAPWLRESVLMVDEKELWERVKITYNEENQPVCRYQENGRCFGITSEKPVREARLWCGKVAVKGAGAIFLYGSGFGYPLFEIFEQKQPHTLVVVFEENICLFAAMLYYFDFEHIMRTQKIVFLIGEAEYFARAFDQLFFSIVFAGCTSPSFAFTHAAARNFKAQYLKIHKYVFSQLGLYVFYIGNDHLDNLIGLDNLLSNTREIVQNPYISCLKDTYKNVPAFIVANGPSLDGNIHELKKIQGNGLIICCESAVIPLLKNQIKPDILTIIERTKYTYTYHFENIEHPRDMALLCLGLVDKHVFPSFHGEKIPIFRNMEATNQWINKYLGDGSALNAGANVSHLAFELAVYLGANPIVFVGQDYAYGVNGQTHSRDSVYFEEKGSKTRKIIESKPVVYIEGITGAMVASNQLWSDFKHGLELKIACHPDKTIINATEGGAKIKGTICLRLCHAIEEYCKKPIPRRVNEIILENKKNISYAERKHGLVDFIKSVEAYSDIFRSLSHLAVERKLASSQMIRLAQEKNIEDYRIVFEDTYQQNIKAYQSFISDDLCRCFSQQVIFAYYYLLNRLGLADTADKIAEVFRIQHDFFRSLNIVCQSVSVYLKAALGQLTAVIRDFDGEAGIRGCDLH